jgi:putative transposase
MNARETQGAPSIEHLCRLSGVSRAGFYRFGEVRAPKRAEADLRDKIQTIALKNRFYGYRRVCRDLWRVDGLKVNHKHVLRLMREDNLLRLRERPFVPYTTNSRHEFPIVANLTRGRVPTGLDQIWVADITYVRLAGQFVYLAVVLDAFSRRVIGWALADHLEASLAIEALDMALSARNPKLGLIHHSDRGVQGGFKRSSQRAHSVLCQPSVKGFGRGRPAEGLSWSRVEGCGDSGERLGAVHAQVRALRKVLAQQSIGVLVGAALPRALRIAEIDLDACIDFERRVLSHLGALVPGQRASKFLRQAYDGARDGIANSLGAMPRESGSILSSRNVAMTVQSRQMQ